MGRIEAGSRPDIIPDEAYVSLDLRTRTEPVRQRMPAAVRRIAHGECLAAGCPREPEVTVGTAFPVTVNDAATDTAVAAVHGEVFGAGTVFDPGPAMGSEDFSEPALGSLPYAYRFVTTPPRRGVGAGARRHGPGEVLGGAEQPPPLCFPRSCKRAAGLRARHDCSPLSIG
ncbi:hypothetical protein ACFY8B_11740 [Streptomyces sp. NPDC012751]|uniref:hypothetical protein n=1 Tax=Streptomyces sp. NPDC012751 TaxID=3364846 RepID=UPI00368C6C1E